MTAVAAGMYFNLALKSDGTVWAWGNNMYGALGDGTTTDRASPVQVSGLSGVVGIAAGLYHGVAVKSDGSAWAWGYNSNGQLGDGTTANRLTPSQVAGLSTATRVAAGGYHSLALMGDGTVRAWGYNANGQLGDGTATTRLTPVQATGISGSVLSLAGGEYHSIAVTSAGTVWTWGGSDFGQLGDGARAQQYAPEALGSVTGQSLVAAGALDSRALTQSRTQTTTYSYDNLYRLTGAAGPSGTTLYSYDPAGNRLSKVLGGQTTSYTYDRADRILTAGSTAYTVNAAGNETARGADTFSYDQANRLTSATVGGVTTTYAYDGDGKRISSTGGGTTTRYVYDVGGGLPVLLDDSAQKYGWGQGLAYTTNEAGTLQGVYHTDGLGSVRAITDSTGSVVQTYQTDEFGIPTQAQGASPQPFGYTGEQVDPTGLVYLRSRTYDPTAGRFLQRNPLPGFISSITAINRCSYTQDNPVSLVDHTGLSPAEINPYQDNCLITCRLNLR